MVAETTEKQDVTGHLTLHDCQYGAENAPCTICVTDCTDDRNSDAGSHVSTSTTMGSTVRSGVSYPGQFRTPAKNRSEIDFVAMAHGAWGRTSTAQV